MELALMLTRLAYRALFNLLRFVAFRSAPAWGRRPSPVAVQPQEPIP